MQGNKKARRKNKKVNYLMTLVFTVAAALAIYFAVSFFSAYKEINEKKEELSNLQAQKEEQVQLNKDIEKTIKENVLILVFLKKKIYQFSPIVLILIFSTNRT